MIEADFTQSSRELVPDITYTQEAKLKLDNCFKAQNQCRFMAGAFLEAGEIADCLREYSAIDRCIVSLTLDLRRINPNFPLQNRV